jgi:nitroimidazol reductase NimA-like FMN-containing flavoprotein (pyridoxamine 5'-phosphate oxidase superfamily)
LNGPAHDYVFFMATTSTPAQARSERSHVRRKDRAKYDCAFIDAVLDEALVCHLAFVVDGQPCVIPTTYARVGDQIYVHGAAATRFTKVLAAGADVALEVTILDGIVLAKSAFHHSMNYRSVVVFGRAREVDDPTERERALEAIVEHAAPGRMKEVRAPSTKELHATRVIAIPIEDASGKSRTGGPIDDEEDRALPVATGVIPVRTERGALVPGYGCPGTP